jgi:hypothetical protein
MAKMARFRSAADRLIAALTTEHTSASWWIGNRDEAIRIGNVSIGGPSIDWCARISEMAASDSGEFSSDGSSTTPSP